MTSYAFEDYLEEFDERYLESYNQVIGGPLTDEFSGSISRGSERLQLSSPLLEHKELKFEKNSLSFNILPDTPLIPLDVPALHDNDSNITISEQRFTKINNTSSIATTTTTETIPQSKKSPYVEYNDRGSFDLELGSLSNLPAPSTNRYSFTSNFTGNFTGNFTDESFLPSENSQFNSIPLEPTAAYPQSLNPSPLMSTKRPTIRRRATTCVQPARCAPKTVGNPFYKPIHLNSKPIEKSLDQQDYLMHMKRRKVSSANNSSYSLVDDYDLAPSYLDKNMTNLAD